jgi:hypothetical protein
VSSCGDFNASALPLLFEQRALGQHLHKGLRVKVSGAAELGIVIFSGASELARERATPSGKPDWLCCASART